MSEELNVVGDNNQSVGDTPKQEDKAFLALKAEKKAIKEELERTKSELKKREELELQKQGEYQKLYETEKAEKEELAQKVEQIKRDEMRKRKLEVFIEEMGVRLVKNEYYKHADFESIPIDETTGDVDRNIAKAKASKFLQTYPELVEKSSVRLPSDAPATQKGITAEEWQKLPLAEKRKHYANVIKK